MKVITGIAVVSLATFTRRHGAL